MHLITTRVPLEDSRGDRQRRHDSGKSHIGGTSLSSHPSCPRLVTVLTPVRVTHHVGFCVLAVGGGDLTVSRRQADGILLAGEGPRYLRRGQLRRESWQFGCIALARVQPASGTFRLTARLKITICRLSARPISLSNPRSHWLLLLRV